MRHDVRSIWTRCAIAMRMGVSRASAAALVCVPLAAQEPAPGPQQVRPPEDPAQREMKELFKTVELRLREIDRLLSDAGAGDKAALKQNLDSGMGALLESSKTRGREAIEGIDRILELAHQMSEQSKSGSGGAGPPKPGESQGSSPLDQRGEQSTQRESTPSSPEKPGEDGPPKDGQKPGGDKQEQGSKPDEAGQQPRDGRDSRADPKNSPGAKPPGSATEGASRTGDGKDRWGELPVHARDVFRIEGGGDMPVQYRDWIDSYYRRLSRNP